MDRPFGTYNNVAKANAQGIELSLVLRPVKELIICSNYSLIRAENRAWAMEISANASLAAPAKISTARSITVGRSVYQWARA
jgi:outer membrane cobalamin receptor